MYRCQCNKAYHYSFGWDVVGPKEAIHLSMFPQQYYGSYFTVAVNIKDEQLTPSVKGNHFFRGWQKVKTATLPPSSSSEGVTGSGSLTYFTFSYCQIEKGATSLLIGMKDLNLFVCCFHIYTKCFPTHPTLNKHIYI